MKILLLGVGLQGKAALYDLVRSDDVDQIIAADRRFDELQTYVKGEQYGDKVICEYVDAASGESIERLLVQKPDVIINLLPKIFLNSTTIAAIQHGIHLVNTSYTTPEMTSLSGKAEARGVTILPEFGMDPGIDLVLLGESVRALDSVDEIITYGAGFPELNAANNPLKYKVAYTFEGVLLSYRRAGRVIRNGALIDFDETDMFSPEQIHEIEFDGLGMLEAFPNGDAVKYANLLGIEVSGLKQLGRFVLRWPGHCAFWKTLVELGFLNDEPLMFNGMPVDRKRYLAALIEPKIQYADGERDVVVVRTDVAGFKDGQRKRLIYQVIDYRDLNTGFTSMSRTVGFTASIGAQMIGRGEMTKRGILSPVNDVPYALFVKELKKREVNISHKKYLGDFLP